MCRSLADGLPALFRVRKPGRGRLVSGARDVPGAGLAWVPRSHGPGHLATATR